MRILYNVFWSYASSPQLPLDRSPSLTCFNFMLSFCEKQNQNRQINKTIKSILGYSMTLGWRKWSRSVFELLGITLIIIIIKITDSHILSAVKFQKFIFWWMDLCPLHVGICLAWTCLGLVSAVTRTGSSYVQLLIFVSEKH